jgi:hypothetical protein
VFVGSHARPSRRPDAVALQGPADGAIKDGNRLVEIGATAPLAGLALTSAVWRSSTRNTVLSPASKRRRSLSYCSDAFRCADAAASSRSGEDRTAWSGLRTSTSIACSSRWRCRAICSAAISARATFAFAVRLPNGSSTWSCTSAVGKRRSKRFASDPARSRRVMAAARRAGR